MSLFKFLVDLQKDKLDEKDTTDLDKYLMALSMYVHFHYDTIVSEPKMMDFLVSSDRLLNKFHSSFTQYTRRQVESIFISFNLLIYLFICGIISTVDANVDDLD